MGEIMSKFFAFVASHKWTLLLTIGSAVILTLLLTIGFWKTLLIVSLIGIAFFVGFFADKYGFSWFKEQLSKLFDKK